MLALPFATGWWDQLAQAAQEEEQHPGAERLLLTSALGWVLGVPKGRRWKFVCCAPSWIHDPKNLLPPP